jgi:RND family efflux transporter MFP subunit
MNHKGRILLGIAILLAAVGISRLIFAFKPEAETIVLVKPIPDVEAVTVARESAAVVVPSQGMVHALTETSVASEVSGRILEVDPRFEVGGQFSRDEVILRIDSADYEAALAQAEATAAKMTVELAMEEGRARQAKRDWEKLGGDETPSALVQRLPQLESAQAGLKAANAAVEKARLDVERCTVKAPYDCRVVEKHTDFGSFVTIAGRIADLESVGAYEVRLPVPLEDFAFIDVSNVATPEKRPSVTLAATIGVEKREWRAEIIRTEGGIDRESRSVYLVARITAEGAHDDVLLQPGLFLRASVSGITMENVIPVPRRALYEGDVVLVVDKDNTIRRRAVTVLRTSIDHAYIKAGLEAGERVCLTPINAAIEGMEVRVVEPDQTPQDEDGAAEATGRERT